MREPYRAYCLDEAIGFFGGTVENELAECQGKDYDRLSKVVLKKYFGEDDESPTGVYADPAIMFGVKAE